MLFSLTVLWLLANHIAQTRLQDQIAAIQAQGEPILAQDLNRPPIPDQDNKAFYIRQAFEQHWPKVPGQSVSIIQTNWYKENGVDSHTGQPIQDPINDNAAYLAQCQPLIETILAASQASNVDWQNHHSKHNLSLIPLTEITESRNLGRLLMDACSRHLQENQPDRALQCAEAILETSNTLLLDPNSNFLKHLNAIGIQSLAWLALEETYPHLTENQTPAVRSLLDHLMDESSFRASAARSLNIERVRFFDLLDWSLNNPQTISQTLLTSYGSCQVIQTNALQDAWAHLAKPIYVADGAICLNAMALRRQIFQTTTSLPAYQKATNQQTNFPYQQTDFPFQVNTTNFDTHTQQPFSVLMASCIDGFVAVHHRGITRRRLAATALALKIHQWDHHGQAAQTLADLVPDYLPEIPIDAMDPKGRPLIYLPSGQTPAHSKAGNPLAEANQQTSGMPLSSSPHTQTPPLLHSIGPSGVVRTLPLALNADNQLRPDTSTCEKFHIDHFSLEAWPTTHRNQTP